MVCRTKLAEPSMLTTFILVKPFHDSYLQHYIKKSRIPETKHLSTDADSSTDTTVGWTKNTRKPNFFEKGKKSSKTQKLKNV